MPTCFLRDVSLLLRGWSLSLSTTGAFSLRLLGCYAQASRLTFRDGKAWAQVFVVRSPRHASTQAGTGRASVGWAHHDLMRAWIYFLPCDSTTILRLTQTGQLGRTLMLSQAHCVVWFFEISVLLVLTRERDTSGKMVSLQQIAVKSSTEEGPQALAAQPSSCPPDYNDFLAILLNAQCSAVHTDTWILWIWKSPFLIGVCLSKTDTIAVVLHLGVPDTDPIFGSNNPFTRVTYQITCISGIYITIHSNRKIIVMK